MSSLDPRDLETETFSNGRGWRAVRVTHRPSALAVERARTNDLRSAVQAQRECIDELRRLVARHAPSDDQSATDVETEALEETRAPEAAGQATTAATGVVSRAEFDRLVARVRKLEKRLAAFEAAGTS